MTLPTHFTPEVMTLTAFRRYIDGSESTKSVSINPATEEGGDPVAFAGAVADLVAAALPYHEWTDTFMHEFVENMRRRYGACVEELDDEVLDDEDLGEEED